MPPKARGGGKKGPPPPPYTEADVAEFRAVTGCDSDAAAKRSLASTRGNLSEAVLRYLDVHAAVPKPTHGDDKAETVARRQANLHEAKRPRVEAAEGTDADGAASAPFAFDLSGLVGTPRPDEHGWVTSMTQELEAEAETVDATVGWARTIEALEAAADGRRRFEDASFPPDASSIDGGRADKESESVPCCRCGARAKIKSVHKDGPNHGRWFYACGNQPANAWAARAMVAKRVPTPTCQFFKWADDAPSSESSKAMRWRRFEPPRFRLTRGTASGAPKFAPSDVRQGAVGDCWLLSALAVVAERQDLVARVVGPAAKCPAATRRGAFLVRLFLAGRWRGVAVDPCLPVSGRSTKVLAGANKVGARSNDEYALAYSRAADNQLWVPLVEKAYAKSHGSYHAISGGWIAEGLLDLTGCPTETIRLDASGFKSEEAWRKLLSYAAAKFPMGCATQGDPSHREVGLVGNHAYSVMEVRELHGASVGRQTKLTSFVAKERVEDVDAAAGGGGPPLRLLRIRNPWGRKEWSGEWGAGSEVWTSKLGAELGHTRVDDGTFWMSWHDFLCRFTVVDVCKAHEGWHAISVQAVSAENDPAFEVEVAPDRGASSSSSWAYAMSLQPNKRGLCSERFWYADVGIAVYRKGESKTLGPTWTPVTGRLGARERVAQVELMFEVGVTYLVRFFSVTGHKAGPPPILRLYSARPLRVRPMRTPNLIPNLAPALHSMLLPSSSPAPNVQEGTRRGGSSDSDIKRRLLPLCGGALVVCRCRGGAFVLGVSASPRGSPPLRVWLRIRSGRVGGMSALHQHPPPPAPGTVHEGPIPGASLHEIPAGRCRVLALALALSPSDTCSHALEIATEQVCDCRAKLKGIGDRRAGAGDEDEVAVVDLEEEETDAEEEEEEEETDAEEEEKEEDGDDEVEIIGEVKPKPKEDASTLFEELGLPPPPPGATDEAIARMLADALAVAAARGARDERRREDDSPDDSSDVEVVGEVASTASERRQRKRAEELARPATAPPARLAQVFAHLPVPEAFRREVSAMRGSRCSGGAQT